MSRLKPFRPLSAPVLIPIIALALALSGLLAPLAGQSPPRVVTDHFTVETVLRWQGASSSSSAGALSREGDGGPRLDGELVRAWRQAQRSPGGSAEQAVMQTLRRSVVRDDAGRMMVEYLTLEATAGDEGGRDAVFPAELIQGLLDGTHSIGPEELEADGLEGSGKGEGGGTATTENPVRSFVALDAWRLASGPPPGAAEADLAEMASWLRRRLPLELAALEVQPAVGGTTEGEAEGRSWTIRAELSLTPEEPETFEGTLQLIGEGGNLALELDRSDAWTAELDRVGDLAFERHQRLVYRIETTQEVGTEETGRTDGEVMTEP